MTLDAGATFRALRRAWTGLACGAMLLGASSQVTASPTASELTERTERGSGSARQATSRSSIPATRRDPVAAEVLFHEGRRALERDDFARACRKFRESQRLDPGAGTLMNWATCEEKLGKVASAWQHFHEALDLLAPGDDRVAFARARAAELERRLPRLTLELHADAPDDTEVRRNGVLLGKASLGSALPVDPGKVELSVRAPGHRVTRYVVRIAAGEQRKLVVRPGAPLPEEQSDPSGRNTLGWVVGGVGVVAAGAAIVTGIMVRDRKKVAAENCPDGACNAVGLEAARAGEKLVVANAVASVTAALGIGTGAILILTSGSDEPGSDRAVNGALLGYEGSF
jgi:tetratricopeptide (TPR) repeat protein